jgi:aminomethyltransferase
MSVGTAFHERTAPLNRKLQWREWSGYWAASAYADHHDIEYNAIRSAAALIDVTPLYKYRISGPDAQRFVDRVMIRDAAKLREGRVFYTCWCDEDGKVVDDGTVARLDETTYRWTAADPSLRWFTLNAGWLDVEIEDISETIAAVALQGPASRDVLERATGEPWGDLRYFGRRPSRIGDLAIDVSRTGYTGDLGYELWVEAGGAVALWDGLMAAGEPHGLRPAGMLALDVVRLEAGLILLEVDYTSSRAAEIPEQAYAPGEIGLGWMFDPGKATPYVGRRALLAEDRKGGPPRRLVGLALGWDEIEAAYTKRGLPPAISPVTSRVPVPVTARGRQVGRATSTGWSPILKRAIALASVEAAFERPGTPVEVEWTVEARRGTVPARVVPLPFLDLERKRA